MKSKIKNLRAREILDSRGEPTVEVELITNFGSFFSSVPSGTSKGKYEAVEIRDGGKRYQGRGVLKAVRNVNQIIAQKLKGKDPTRQREIDNLLIKLDGTKNKSRLGANSILPVSMAVCRAGATAKNLPLYEYISRLFSSNLNSTFSTIVSNGEGWPRPCFNLINGGAHAGNDLEIQEFMVVPQMESFKESLRIASEVYYCLEKILIKKLGKKAVNVGREGGFAPPLKKTKEALDLLMEAIKLAGYQKKVKIALDCAASQFVTKIKKKPIYHFEGQRLSSTRLLEFYQGLIKSYPIFLLEDPFSENDFLGFQEIHKKLGEEILIFGDDLLATNPGRMKMAKEKNLCNGAIIKPNQIGTVTETLEAAKLAKSFGPEGKPKASYGAGWKIMVSHRSGETNDDFIADFAVGISADFIKAGAPARGERVAKYNRLLKIEEELT